MAGYLQEGQAELQHKAVTLPTLQNMKNAGEKIAMLTCYDASFAALMDACAVDMLLVGDSMGNVFTGPRDHLAGDHRRHRLSHGLCRSWQQVSTACGRHAFR